MPTSSTTPATEPAAMTPERLAEIREIGREFGTVAEAVAEIDRLRGALSDLNDELADQKKTTQYFARQSSRRMARLRAVTDGTPLAAVDRAAAEIRDLADPTAVRISTLTDVVDLTLRPQTLEDWHRWTRRLSVDVDLVTNRGRVSTAKGAWKGVPVTVIAEGVGALLAAAREAVIGPDPGEAPCDCGSPWSCDRPLHTANLVVDRKTGKVGGR